MDKSQAIHDFWSGFGLNAYDQNTVPDDARMPYITYEVSTGALDNVLNSSGSLWYNSLSWEAMSQKAEEIARAVGKNGYHIKTIDGEKGLFAAMPNKGK